MGVRLDQTDTSRATMGRVAGTLFLSGSAMTVLGILLPHSPQADVGGFWAMAGGTALGASVLFRYARRLSLRSYECWMLLGSITITLSIYFNGERHGGSSAGNQVLYLWIALYSAYFFSRLATARQLAAIACLMLASCWSSILARSRLLAGLSPSEWSLRRPRSFTL
jgi:hypothetical protein